MPSPMASRQPGTQGLLLRAGLGRALGAGGGLLRLDIGLDASVACP